MSPTSFEEHHKQKTKELKEKRLAVCAECEHVRDLKNRGWIVWMYVARESTNTFCRLPNRKME